MDKLYDLMTTGFKYQVISCKTGFEIIDVTLNHLDSIRSMVSGDVIELVNECHRKVNELYASLSAGSLALVRQTILRILQDRKVKVSPFLLDGIQNTDGSMVIVPAGMLPPEFQIPGQVRFLIEGAGDQIVHYPLPLSGVCETFNGVACSVLGFNLYLKSHARERAAEGQRSAPAPMQDGGACPRPASKKTTAGAELNLLGSLLDMAGAKQEAEEFKLSIFDESKTSAANAGGGGSGVSTGDADGGAVETIVFDQPQGPHGVRASASRTSRMLNDLVHYLRQLCSFCIFLS